MASAGAGRRLQVVASPASVSGNASSAGVTTEVTSGSATATVSGGVAPYSYAWSRSSGSTLIEALTGSLATTAWRGDIPEADPSQVAIFICTVTDAVGAIAVSGGVTVTLEVIL